MKRLSIITIALAAFSAIGSLTSCQDEDFGYESKEIEYQTAFKKSFGTPDANHTWGFHDISSSNEASIITRTANTNANEWGQKGYSVPLPLTARQKEFVTKWFAETYNPQSIMVSWTDYFVQQVSSTAYGRHMDHLYDYSAFNPTTGEKTGDHINNYNSGDCGTNGSVSSPLVKDQYTDRIQYMVNQSTKGFAFSESNASKLYTKNFVIIPGEWIDPNNILGNESVDPLKDEKGKVLQESTGGAIHTTNSIWGMYFVGFDYESFKFEGSPDNVARDYYFNDWIVRICPANIIKNEPVRIMAEDLGLIGDFDFNDVVFDVYMNYNQYDSNKTYGFIMLQAAGGTLELSVAGHEVHEAFEVPTNTVVNVGENPNDPFVTRGPTQLKFTPTSANPIDIPIVVKLKDGTTYSIGTERGKAPGKFAVPTTVQWSPEIVNIKTTYPKFPEWVQDESKHFWE